MKQRQSGEWVVVLDLAPFFHFAPDWGTIVSFSPAAARPLKASRAA